MQETINEINAQTYYLPYQVIASLILALGGFFVGLILAWIIWGHNKARAAAVQAKNEELKARLD